VPRPVGAPLDGATVACVVNFAALSDRSHALLAAESLSVSRAVPALAIRVDRVATVTDRRWCLTVWVPDQRTDSRPTTGAVKVKRNPPRMTVANRAAGLLATRAERNAFSRAARVGCGGAVGWVGGGGAGLPLAACRAGGR
jgi:hypothetical protein